MLGARGLPSLFGTQGLKTGTVRDSTYHSCGGKAMQLERVLQEEGIGILELSSPCICEVIGCS